MNILAIDTSTDAITLGLAIGDKKVYYTGEKGCKKHNSTLLQYIDDKLRKNGVSIRDIDVFGVVRGPGSFTGIRIAVATANALAMGVDAKIVEVTSLEQMFDGTDQLVLLDCGHDHYYAAIAEQGKEPLYTEISVEQLSSYSMKKCFLTISDPEKILAKCVEKAGKGLFVKQATPFYMKQSSAERQ